MRAITIKRRSITTKIDVINKVQFRVTYGESHVSVNVIRSNREVFSEGIKVLILETMLLTF